jgi:hypothetical protein
MDFKLPPFPSANAVGLPPQGTSEGNLPGTNIIYLRRSGIGKEINRTKEVRPIRLSGFGKIE